MKKMAAPKVVLAFDIWRDIQRNLLSYTVMVLVEITAFALIYYTHINRQTTSELEIILTERDELDIEWRNLLLEQNSLAEHSAIETQAIKLLDMHRPNANTEIIIRLP